MLFGGVVIFGNNGLVISGHRDLAEGDHSTIRKSMAEFVGYNEFDYIMFGGARGADTVALASVLELRKTGAKTPFLVVVVPDTLSAQPRQTRDISLMADRLIELHHPVTPADHYWALHHRNEFMLDWVYPKGRLLAFWNEKKSGTANAVAYAKWLGMDVSIRSIKGSEH